VRVHGYWMDWVGREMDKGETLEEVYAKLSRKGKDGYDAEYAAYYAQGSQSTASVPSEQSGSAALTYSAQEQFSHSAPGNIVGGSGHYSLEANTQQQAEYPAQPQQPSSTQGFSYPQTYSSGYRDSSMTTPSTTGFDQLPQANDGLTPSSYQHNETLSYSSRVGEMTTPMPPSHPFPDSYGGPSFSVPESSRNPIVPPDRPASPFVSLAEAQRLAPEERFLEERDKKGRSFAPPHIYHVNRQMEDGHFRSDTEFAEQHKLNQGAISEVLRGLQPQHMRFQRPKDVNPYPIQSRSEKSKKGHEARVVKQYNTKVTEIVRATSPARKNKDGTTTQGTEHVFTIAPSLISRKEGKSAMSIDPGWLKTNGAYETAKDEQGNPISWGNGIWQYSDTKRVGTASLQKNSDSRKKLMTTGTGGGWRRTDEEGVELYKKYRADIDERNRKNREERKNKRQKR